MGRHLVCRVCVLGLIMLWSIGCAPRVRQPLPPQWPATWDGRQLYNTAPALIYARHEAAADEAERRVARVQEDFVKRTGGSVHQGLIIINDTDDEHFGDLTPDEMMIKAPPDEIVKMGLSKQELALGIPTPLTNDRLTGQLGFSADAVKTISGATALPSERRAKQFSSRMIDGALKKADINFAARVLILPFMPMIQGMANDMLQAMLDVMVYRQFCFSQSDWSETRQKDEAKAYEEMKLKKMTKSIQATTQAATTQARVK